MIKNEKIPVGYVLRHNRHKSLYVSIGRRRDNDRFIFRARNRIVGGNIIADVSDIAPNGDNGDDEIYIKHFSLIHIITISFLLPSLTRLVRFVHARDVSAVSVNNIISRFSNERIKNLKIYLEIIW